MQLKSTFKEDLAKEQKLCVLLDTYYAKHLKYYSFKRINTIKQQFLGIDVIFIKKETGLIYTIDEKAQLDYINESLPTFAFELYYQKNGLSKEGWLFDPRKTTQFYALVTSIYSDEPGCFTSCNITLVNREKLIALLNDYGLSKKVLARKIAGVKHKKHKVSLDELDSKKEGYLYFSSTNKAEKPINLILRLAFLVKAGVAKRLV